MHTARKSAGVDYVCHFDANPKNQNTGIFEPVAKYVKRMEYQQALTTRDVRWTRYTNEKKDFPPLMGHPICSDNPKWCDLRANTPAVAHSRDETE